MSPLNLLPIPRRVERLAGLVQADAPVVERRDAALPPEGYRLTVADGGIAIESSTPTGAFYAHQTLAQLRRLHPRGLPAVRIEDWPDYAVRGVMLDVSRDKVPTMATLFATVDRLASWKVNQLQLYTEHTFAYAGHEAVWRDASPITPDEVAELQAYCRERFVELVPNQNAFGHMERWLKHPGYRDLAECPGGATWWGRHRPAATLNPLDPRSIELVRGLFDQLLPRFESTNVNVGCDETMELGMGRSREACEAHGRERVYLDFLRQVHAHVHGRHGRVPQFWGDVILHAPELVAELPRPIVALEWGYEATHPFDERCAKFAAAGVPFHVCPGTSSWCSLAGRTDACVANLRNAAEAGQRHGAGGYLNTDWGDAGHLQPWPVSDLGLAVGAAMAWCSESNREMPVAEAVSLHAFGDASGVAGRVASDLGNVYQSCGKLVANGSALFRLLVPILGWEDALGGLRVEGLERSLSAIDAAIAPLATARMDRPDAALVADEFRHAAAMLRLACRRGIARLRGDEPRDGPPSEPDLPSIVAEHRRLWLARNRPGGLVDSTARLTTGKP